jgi:Cys-tRNA synthase (O-phospho-L-seryl-tRNA:Cys-tRNA synthase)
MQLGVRSQNITLLSTKLAPVRAEAAVVLVLAGVTTFVFVVNEVEVLPKFNVGSGWKSMTLGTEKSAGVLVMPSVANL